jgi:hypothetical protein
MNDAAAFSGNSIAVDAPEPEHNFGRRMMRLKAERGLPHNSGAGRKPLSEKYRKQVQAVEQVFANALPELARTYLDELQPHDPERCPTHHRVLVCPVAHCGEQSQRTAFDFKAAAYALDRILGKPSIRVEATVTARFVEQLTLTLTAVFEECNEHTDPAARRAAFINGCRALVAP